MIETRTQALGDAFRTLFESGTLTGLGEGELLERFLARRDEAAFAELVARHGPMVLSVCRRWLDDPAEVEDAFQATFLVLVRKAAGLRDRRALGPWLFGVACRVSRHARASNVRRRLRERRVPTDRTPAPDPSAELADRELRALIDEEIRRLPRHQRDAAVLALVQGMTHQAAAQALGWPLGTFKTRIADARATLARRLARRGVGPAGMAFVTWPESASLPKVLVPESLIRRVVDAAQAATAGGLVGTAARGMLFGRMLTVAAGLTALACALIVPGWWGGGPGVEEGADAVVTAPPAPEPKRDRYGDPLPAGAVLRLGTVQYRQETPIYRIAWLPDGKQFITDGADSILRIWDAKTGRVVRRIDPGVGTLEDYGLTSDGRFIMAMGVKLENDRFIQNAAMINLRTGQANDRGSWTRGFGRISKLALCPDRRLVAIGYDWKGEVRVFEAWNGSELFHFNLGSPGVGRIEFAQDGRRLAVGGSEVKVYDVDKKKEYRKIRQKERCVDDFALSPDSRWLATSTFEDGFRVWDLASGRWFDPGVFLTFQWAAGTLSVAAPDIRFLRGESFDGQTSELHHPAFSSDGKMLAGVDSKGRIHVFEPKAGKKIARLGTKTTPPRQVVFSPDNRTLLGVAGPSVLACWDIASRDDRFARPDAHIDGIQTILCAPDGKTLISEDDDRTIRRWDLTTGQPLPGLPQFDASVEVMTLSDDGLLAASNNSDHQVFVWDLDKPADPLVLSYNPSPGLPILKTLCFQDDRTLLGIDTRGLLIHLDLESREATVDQPFRVLPPDSEKGELRGLIDVYDAVFLPGGRKLAVREFSGDYLFEIKTGKELLKADLGRLTVPSPDGWLLAVASVDGDERLTRPNPARYSADCFEDGYEAGKIRLIETATGRETARIRVEDGEVWALAFSPDGKTLVATSGADSGRIHFYDVANGRETRTIETPPLRSPALTFTPDGHRLITGMADGSILVWKVK